MAEQAYGPLNGSSTFHSFIREHLWETYWLKGGSEGGWEVILSVCGAKIQFHGLGSIGLRSHQRKADLTGKLYFRYMAVLSGSKTMEDLMTRCRKPWSLGIINTSLNLLSRTFLYQ